VSVPCSSHRQQGVVHQKLHHVELPLNLPHLQAVVQFPGIQHIQQLHGMEKQYKE
jgi:hypothetical protein